ncbi:MAG: hypothetical protein U1A78_41550 [Polyangia bacterium]
MFKRAAAFIKHRCGPRWLAPFTGNDYPAFEAFCSLVALWSRADLSHRAAAVMGMRGALTAMQESVRHVAYLAIVAIGDWFMVPRLLPYIVPEGDSTSPRRLAELLQQSGELGQIGAAAAHPPPKGAALLRLELWPGSGLVDLRQLQKVSADDLVSNGWSHYEAHRWLHALQYLARDSEMAAAVRP